MKLRATITTAPRPQAMISATNPIAGFVARDRGEQLAIIPIEVIPPGLPGPPGPEGPPGPSGDNVDPGDLTLIFDNKLL